MAKQTKLSSSDAKITMLLDAAVDRGWMTGEICDALERLRLYSKNLGLMDRIDRSELLLDDLQRQLFEGYHRAQMRLSAGLIDQLKKLSPEGLDAYWTNGRRELAFDPDLFPWRE